MALSRGNPNTWWPRFIDVVVLTRAVPGRGTRWLLQLLFDEDGQTAPHSVAMSFGEERPYENRTNNNN